MEGYPNPDLGKKPARTLPPREHGRGGTLGDWTIPHRTSDRVPVAQ